MYDIQVSYSNPVPRAMMLFRQRAYRDGVRKAASRIAEMTIEVAKNTYLQQRKSTEPTSLVVDSMTYEAPQVSGQNLKLLVLCGGTTAPHAKYVEYDRTLVNGVKWNGYYFMRTAATVVSEHAATILRAEIIRSIRR